VREFQRFVVFAQQTPGVAWDMDVKRFAELTHKSARSVSSMQKEQVLMGTLN
jgi:hypothetical protein